MADELCECGHRRDAHFMGMYNCGQCPGDRDCLLFQAAVLHSVEEPILQPLCECGSCAPTAVLPLEAWSVAGSAGHAKGLNGTDLLACAPGHCPECAVVLEEHDGWQVCGATA